MDISQALTSDLFLEDVFKLIVMVVAKVTGVDICSLWLVDDTANPPKVRLKATQAIEPEYVIDRSLNLNEGVVGHVISTQRPLVIDNVLDCEMFKEKEMARKLGLVSMVGVPLWQRPSCSPPNCFDWDYISVDNRIGDKSNGPFTYFLTYYFSSNKYPPIK